MDTKTLEKLKRIYDQADNFGKELIEKEFPELKENEDERIRKALIEMVHDTTGDALWVDYNVHKEECIAWLEKQAKEARWTNEDENMLNAVLETESLCIENTDVDDEGTKARFGFEREINWLKSIKQRLTSTMKE